MAQVPGGQRDLGAQASQTGPSAGASPSLADGSPILFGELDEAGRQAWFAHVREGYGDHLMNGYATLVEIDRTVDG